MSLAGKGQGRTRQPRGFNDVAKPETTNTNTNTNTGTDFKGLLNQFYQEPKKIEKKQVSIYLDTDVIEALESWVGALPEKKKKGARSDLVNNFLKQVFNIRQGE